MPDDELGRVADALEPMAVGAAVRDVAGEIVDFRVVYVNGPGAALVGRAPDALTGMRLSELTGHPGSADLLPRLVDLLEHGEPFTEDLAWAGRGVTHPVVGRFERVGDRVLVRGYGGDRQIVATLHELAVSETRYRLMAELASDIVMQLDADDVIRWVSPSVGNALGWTPDEMVGRSVVDFVGPDSDTRAPEVRARTVRGETYVFEGQVRAVDTSLRWFRVRVAPMFERGALVARVAGFHDIHDAAVARRASQRSEQRLRSAMESSVAGMALTDLDRRFLDVNPALCRMVGRDRAWLLDHGVADILQPDDDEADRTTRARIVGTDVSGVTVERRLAHADGSMIWAQHSVAVIREDGSPTGFVSQWIDISEAVEARRALAYEATHDHLTHVGNRSDLYAHIDGILARSTPTEPVGVLFMDVDRLKAINDGDGHAAGDAVLVAVAERARSTLRGSDLIARIGGDEFVVVVPALRGPDDAQRIAEKIMAAVETPLVVDGRRIAVTVSIGVVVVVGDADADETLRRADAAAYAAKHAGRRRVVSFDATMSEPPLAGDPPRSR